jgi:hypothetical protein
LAWVWGFGFDSQLPIFGNFGDFGNFHGLLPAPISQNTPPGGSRFVANKMQSDIQQPYDCLVTAIFLYVLGLI